MPRRFSGVHYRAFDGRTDFVFTFEYVPSASSWRAYITRSPGYGARSSSMVDTHRLRDERGWYVCWDSPIRTVCDCQGVAALWADCTLNYINSGSFRPPASRPPVKDRSPLASWSGARRSGDPAAWDTTQPTASRTNSRPRPGFFQRLMERLS